MENNKQNTNYWYYIMENSFEHTGANHIEAAIMAVEIEIAKIKLRLHKTERQRDGLYSLLDNQSGAPYIKEEKTFIIPDNTVVSTSITTPQKETHPTNKPEDFSDYPFGKHIRVRLNYLDAKLCKPFKMRDRLDLIGKIEGEEAKKELGKKFSSKLNYLLATGFYIGAKYNGDNSLVFYFKPDWLIPDGDKYKIKPEYTPRNEDFDFLPEYLRREENIIWLPEKNK